MFFCALVLAGTGLVVVYFSILLEFVVKRLDLNGRVVLAFAALATLDVAASRSVFLVCLSQVRKLALKTKSKREKGRRMQSIWWYGRSATQIGYDLI